MALALGLVASAVAAAAAAVLSVRLREVEEFVARNLPSEGDLQAAVRDAIDRDLLPEARAGGLADLPVRDREAQDPARDLATLVSSCALDLKGADARALEGRVKALYQLGASLALASSEVERCLAPVTERLVGARVMDARVARVECIAPGALVDRKTMWPLTPGSRVRQPLGVVLRADDGRVLSRAKVLARP